MGRTASARERGFRAGIRVLVVFASGVLAFGLLLLVTTWEVALIGSWIVAAGLFLLWVWLGVHTADAQRTKDLARLEDPSRITADVLLVAASGASLVAVALALLRAGEEQGTAKHITIAIAGICLVASWTTVNTVFMLRYARQYYDGDPGGIEFKGEEHGPTYADFAYLAFTIGMTYQVSDTTLASSVIRATALRHALLSFVFVTSVVAITINIVAQLFTR